MKFAKFGLFLPSFCIAFAFMPVLSLAEQYICIADKSAGFRFHKSIRRWVSADFKADSKFVISEQPKQILKEGKFVYEGTYFVVKDMNRPSPPTYFCDKGFNEFGQLDCTVQTGPKEFTFNKKNGRYFREYSGGYIFVLPGDNRLSDDNSDTPFMEIGTCTAF